MGHNFKHDETLKGLGGWRTPFRVQSGCSDPRVVATLQPWAEISERLRRNLDQRDGAAEAIIGDYAGPHNDHHPEYEWFKNGFIDFHVMFANDAVEHHFLVYEENGHFSKMVSVNSMGGISIYRLPFWHYTTPLVGKKGREAEARRWLLLGSFEILS